MTVSDTSLLAVLVPAAFCACTRTKYVPGGTPGTTKLGAGPSGALAKGTTKPGVSPASSR